MPWFNKLARNRKKVSAVAALIVVAAVVLIAYRSFWVFTPAYSARITAKNFFTDIVNDKDQAAYSLTSNQFQLATGYDSFTTQSGRLAGHDLKINFSNYYSDSSGVAMGGTIFDKTFGEHYVFEIKTSSHSNKVVAVLVVPPVNT